MCQVLARYRCLVGESCLCSEGPWFEPRWGKGKALKKRDYTRSANISLEHYSYYNVLLSPVYMNYCKVVLVSGVYIAYQLAGLYSINTTSEPSLMLMLYVVSLGSMTSGCLWNSSLWLLHHEGILFQTGGLTRVLRSFLSRQWGQAVMRSDARQYYWSGICGYYTLVSGIHNILHTGIC